MNENNDQIIIAADAREKIEEALKDRAKAAQKLVPRNRAERRALKKRMGASFGDFEAISETAKKLDYIDLIQKLRELNKRKQNEGYDDEDSEEEN